MKQEFDWQGILNSFARWVWQLAAACLIGFTLLVVLGRQIMPVIDHYRPQISEQLSGYLGIQVESGRIEGSWAGFNPKVNVISVSVSGVPGDKSPSIRIERLNAQPDLLGSLMNWKLVWRELRVGRIKLNLEESSRGGWSVAGLQLADSNEEQVGPADMAALLQALLPSKDIGIDELELTLKFYSGIEAGIHAKNLLLESSDDFHRIVGEIGFGDMAQPARFVFEGQGEPWNSQNYRGRGYLALKGINFDGSISAITRRWFPDLVERLGEIPVDLQSELWLAIQPGGAASLTGRVSANEIPLNWFEDIAPITRLSADVTGWFQPRKDWGIRLQGLKFAWADREILPLNLQYSQKLGASWTDFSLATDHLNVGVLRRILCDAGIVSGTLRKRLDGVNPSGNLQNLFVDFSMENESPKLKLRTNLDNLAVDPYRKSPGARGVSGYLEADLDGGFLELDSPSGFAMYFPKIYADYMEYGATRGRVAWRWQSGKKLLTVAAGPVRITGEEGQGVAYLDLAIPVGAPGGSAEMFLQVGMRNSHSKYRNRYIPKTLNPNLLHWLDDAIGDIALDEVGFIYRGAFKGAERRTIQLYLKANDAALAFHPDWLPLEDLSDVKVVFDDGVVDAEAASGRIGRINLSQIAVALPPTGKESGSGLLVKSKVRSEAADVIAFLKESPMKEKVAMLDDWTLSGQVKGSADLTIPLSAPPQSARYRVNTKIDNGTLSSTPEIGIGFSDIAGTISYHEEKGLFGNKLTGKLWSQPVKGSLAMEDDDSVVRLNGSVAIADLEQEMAVPFGTTVSGETTFDARLIIPSKTSGEMPRITINSALEGITISMPEPFGKTGEQTGSFEAAIELAEDSNRLLARYNDALSGEIFFTREGIERGVVAYRRAEQPPLPQSGLLLSGEFADLDWQSWHDYINELLQPKQQDNGGLIKLHPMFEIGVEKVESQWLPLHNLQLNGAYRTNGWDIDFTADRAVGSVRFAENRPPQVQLKRLHLPEWPQDAEAAAEEFDPRRLPELDVSIEELQLGSNLLGSLSMDIRPGEQGAALERLQGDILGIRFGAGEYRADTRLAWNYDGVSHYSRVEGRMQTDNIGAVLSQMNYESPMESDKAVFQADVAWADKPWKISPLLLSGYLSVDLKDGQFNTSPGEASNAMLRFVGLFNFATWLRRLKLDFTDLFAKGVSYDELHAGLAFSEGSMVFDRPVEVAMPSGRMRMTGLVDLENEQIDARLIATLPVGTNLPWITALIGGLPAAAGVYLTSKLFKKQVDRLSSISYRITGSWDDPVMEVYRVFSDRGGDKKPTSVPEEPEPTTGLADEDEKDSDSRGAP